MRGYCERLDGTFWAEPVNALTNAAFLVAALLAARDVRRLRIARATPRADGGGAADACVQDTRVDDDGRAEELLALVVVLAAIGIGSFLFHTLATGWAALADTLPILLFILGYLVVFARRFGGLSWSRAWLAAPAFLVLDVALNVTVGVPAARMELPVPGLYLPALLVLAGLTGWLATRREVALRRYWRPFALVTALFAVSLTLRQLDGPLCGRWPLGTHFGWHLCNAAVLYLLVRAASRRAATAGPQPFPVTDSR